jgi:outer membrane protein OmpA-like peptidoglycan-associated protein
MEERANTIPTARQPGRARAAGKPPKDLSAPDVFIDEQRRFRLPRPLGFRGASARLARDAEPLLDVIARIIRENPEVRRVHIRAHWDASLPADATVALTQRQAEAIRDALVAREVAAERLVPVGVGSGEPLSTGAGLTERARNRRVELLVAPAG